MEATIGIESFANLSLEQMEQQWINAKRIESA
jgi:hypothetical protein